MKESLEEKERRHLAYIDVNRSVLADRASERYQKWGRGASILGGDNYLRTMLDPILEEMVNTYDPEQEFVILIQEENEDSTFDLSCYKYAFKPIPCKVCSMHVLSCDLGEDGEWTRGCD